MRDLLFLDAGVQNIDISIDIRWTEFFFVFLSIVFAWIIVRTRVYGMYPLLTHFQHPSSFICTLLLTIFSRRLFAFIYIFESRITSS